MSENTVIESAAVPVSNISLYGVLQIPAVRQVILLIGVAASVAAGFAVVLWSQSPSYVEIYSDPDAGNVVEVADALDASGFDSKVDTDAGLVMVAESQYEDANMELSRQGISSGGGSSIESLQERSGFGTSQFMESAMFYDALEAKLAKTITQFGAVRGAVVHLAIPPRSGFIRDSNTASASVFLELNSALQLDPDRANSIINMVAGAIPNLPPGNVKVSDQYARDYSVSADQQGAGLASSQLRYAQQLEDSYKRRIEDLLTPMVGPGRIRAQVSADLDFTVTDATTESFAPQTVVRSEQIAEEEMRDASLLVGGVPGAQSNQPAEVGAEQAAAPSADSTEPVNRSSSTIRNFEMDRTISRTQQQSGRIQRLSIALLIDDAPLEGGDAEQTGLGDAEVERLTALAREAVGFDADRGDTIEVTVAPFRSLPEIPPMEAPPIWQSPLVMDIARLLFGAIVALGLGFGLIRPMFKGLLTNAGGDGSLVGGGSAMLASPGGPSMGGGQAALAAPSFDEKVDAAKNITNHDPARVAQIVRKWVTDNG